MEAVDLETYLVEAYLPRTSPGGGDAVAARARVAAAQMRREGTAIRFLRSFFVPEDELWFGFYQAGSIDEVAEATNRADLVPGRIQHAVDDGASVRGRRASDETTPLERRRS
ncbi:MAG TPA: hypothetical protein VFK76_05780 [Gaiellaceae bacterium]|nr:hypothetical protein [Gaiellaceae bacterium]